MSRNPETAVPSTLPGRLHPQARRLLDVVEERGLPDKSELTPAAAREQSATYRDFRGEPAPVAEVRPLEIPGGGQTIPARLYRPTAARLDGVLVWLHGGGWVVGGLDDADVDARALARASGLAVVSIGYRLAPEHPFPAGLDDAHLATAWVVENRESLGVDGSFVAVGGDSAGGNLAAAVTLLARDTGGPPIDFQLLVYPVTDCDLDSAGYRRLAEGYWLTRDGMEWNWSHYVPEPDRRRQPLASPLRAPSHRDLPPALVITAEFDPLDPEGAAYASALQAAGVPTILTRYNGMIHGFFSCGALIDRADEAVAECGEGLRRQMAQRS